MTTRARKKPKPKSEEERRFDKALLALLKSPPQHRKARKRVKERSEQ